MREKVERRLSYVPVVAFRGETRSRSSGWGGRQLGGILHTYTTCAMLVVSKVNLGADEFYEREWNGETWSRESISEPVVKRETP